MASTPPVTRRPLCAVAAFVVASIALAACASGGQRAPRLSAAEWRPAVAAHLARADTAAALALLDSVAWRRPRDVEAIHALGMLAWAAVRPTKTTDVGAPREKIRLLRVADSSLRWAARLAPDSARYAVDLGRWLLYGNMVQLRIQAAGHIEQGLAAARAAGDRSVEADALDEQGMFAWRSHENMARRRMLQQGYPATSAARFANDLRALQDFVENQTIPFVPPSGLDDADVAIERFRQATRAVPFHPRASRHLAMALAEWERWQELRRFAREWTAGDRANPMAWAALGLAEQRVGATPAAQAAFDSALARLGPAERGRWTRLSRVAKRADSVTYAGLPAGERDAYDRRYWQLADPVTLTPENELRTEFMARVAFAELRWSSEDFDRHGADTDRGDIHVRFGPPPVQFTHNTGGVVTDHVWWYPELRTGFVFSAMVAYGTARHAGDFLRVAENAREISPATWTNVPVMRTLDTVLVQAARFRATGDSTDLVVFAHLPLERMARGSDVASGSIETRFTTTDAAGRVASDEKSSEAVRFDRPDAASRRTFRTRLAPGEHAYRVEAWQSVAGRAARGLGAVTAEATRGFGVSDLLVAERIVPRDSATAGRWTDLRLVPSVGVLRVGQPFGVTWETYDLAARDGQSRYEVTLELVLREIDRSFQAREGMSQQQVATGKARAIVGRILGGIGDVAGATAEGDARIALTYQRARGASPVALEWLSLELGDAPRGDYELFVRVRDLATGARASTSRRLRVER